MRVALLTGANPQRSRGGPQVRLLRGKWIFEVARNGIKNDESVLVLSINGQCHEASSLEIDETAIAQVHFATRGSENHISMFAVKVA